MSRGRSRKGISTRGRTESSSNGVTLSADSECKAGETTKLEIRTDGVKQAEREVAVGFTQLRKSDSNNGSGTAMNGQLRVLLETLNDKAPIHDSTHSSMPQPAPLSPTRGQYMDRFGHIHPVDIIDLTRISPSVDVIRTTPGNHEAVEQQDTSIQSSTRRALRARPKINEVCRMYLRNGCPWGYQCDRIHPSPKDGISGMRSSSSNADLPDESPGPDSLLAKKSQNPVLNTEQSETPTECLAPSIPRDPQGEAGGSTPDERGSQRKLDEVCRKYLRNGHPSREAVDPGPFGVQVSRVQAAQCATVDNTCGSPSVTVNETMPPEVIGNSLPVDIIAAPSSQSCDNCLTSNEEPHTGREICRLFLRHRCFDEKRCGLLHSRKGSETQAPNTVADGTRASETVLDGKPDGINDNSKRGRQKSQKICRRYLEGQRHDYKYCRYLHLDRNLSPSQQRSPDMQLNETSRNLDMHNTSDNGIPNQDPDSDHALFSQSLLDISSSSAASPFVRVPNTEQLLIKTGPRKKKKHIPEKILKVSAANTDGVHTAQGGRLTFAGTESILASAPVVKLPSRERCVSVSTEPDDLHGTLTGQLNCNKSSFSTDSQASDDSVTIFSDFSISAPSSQSSYSRSHSGAVACRTPPLSDICLDWLLGCCTRMKCTHKHIDRPTTHHVPGEQPIPLEPPGLPSRMPLPVVSVQDKTALQHRADCLKCTCGVCDGCARQPITSVSGSFVTCDEIPKGFQKPTQRPNLAGPASVRQPPPLMTVTVLEHTKIRLGAGFEVQEITTGFESRWVVLSNIPSTVTEKTIRRVLKPFGQVDDLRVPATPSTPSMNIKALFSTSSEAMQAVSALNDAHIFDRRISARLPVNNTARGNGTLQDSSVKIEWNIPGKLGFAGYASQTEAEAAVSAANGHTLHDSSISAIIYEGLPTLGAVNVRFVGLPPSIAAEDLNQFGQPEAVMLERPNYSSLAHAIKGVQGLLDDFGQVLGFEVFPGPYKDGIVRGLAHFSSPSVAHTASHHLNGRRPYFIGKGKLIARHIRVLSYTLPYDVYNKLASDIAWLRRSFWIRGRGAVLSVVDRQAERFHDPSLPVFIKLSAEDIGELGHLKSEFEKLLHGEIVVQNGRVVWDGFFGRPAGAAFLHELERANPEISIQKSIGRRTITLFGPMVKRQRIRQALLDMITRIQAQQTRTIPVAGRLIALFMSAELMDLQKHLGHENVVLNLVRHTITVRGNDAAYDAVTRAVREVQKHQADGRKDDTVECPVCFSQVVSPIQLECGHSWCRSCFAHYLIAAIDNKIFPLTCLGNEATCSQLVSVHIARDVLTADDFDRVVNASFFSYVYARPDEFHYCPTPDCPQIYRSAPPDTVLQCPSCLARICPSCHVEAHDGISCINHDLDGEKLFKEWMEAHDVKCCPGCKSSIEKIAGCNHMTCSRCQTHICWVCLETFPKAEGIYDHMRAAHGGIGL